ncbi:MAG TPA: hypothetical protein VNI84_21095 [Pyrinomonadaceae bacterium]|nr:hypothetical protein [Pyrinomonadaceae bacterium]
MPLTPEQITKTSLAALITYDAAAARIGGLNLAQETELTSLLGEWNVVKRKYSDLTGKIAGYTTYNAAKRLAVRNDIRVLLGLPQITGEAQAAGAVGGESYSSSNVSSTFEF